MSKITRVVPVLVYEDLAAAHDFLVNAFGFSSGGVQRDGEGQAVHAEVTAGDTVIWLHRSVKEFELAAPRALGASCVGLSVQLDDVDAHFARARAQGARIDSEPTDQPYGLREYGARDPEGHRFWFSSPLA
jgi:uncharacterized glyoxalase superfamily protein PhnB